MRSSIIASVFFFLIPILAIPVAAAPFELTKIVLALVCLLMLLAIALVSALRSGSLSLPFSSLAGALAILPLAYLVSAAFSVQPALSFAGYGLDTASVGGIAIGAVLALVIAFAFKDSRATARPLLALLAGGAVALLFQLIQILGNAPLPLAMLANPIANLIGSWSDFGIFSGFMAIMALLSFSAVPLGRVGRVVAIVTLAVSVFFLGLVGMAGIWIMVGFAAFALIGWELSRLYGSGFRLGKSMLPAIVVVIALFFVFFGAPATGGLQRAFNVQTLDVRPSLQGTLSIMGELWSKNPVTSSGPNTFASAWELYRPSEVLATPFWNAGFEQGSSVVLTAAAVGGIVAALAWLLLLASLAYAAIRSLLARTEERYPVTALLAVGALYLGVAHLIYVPSATLFLMFFGLVGLFLASVQGTLLRVRSFSFAPSPHARVAVTLGSMLILAGGLAALFGATMSYVGAVSYNRAVIAAGAGDAGAAKAAIRTALAVAPNDRAYRAATAISLSELRTITQGPTGAAAEEAFREALIEAVAYSGNAVVLDPLAAANWLSREEVYAAVVPLNIEGAYENAIAALQRARALSPASPEVDFRLAVLEAARGKTDAARTAIAAALQKKPDYTSAILFMAQMDLEQGNLAKAIESVKGAVYFEPENPTLLYQLGVLLLAQKSYADAATAFTAALDAEPTFQNAKFFLAQSYAFLGNTNDAANLMRELVVANPTNADVRGYLTKLEAGQNPFAVVTAPPETEPGG